MEVITPEPEKIYSSYTDAQKRATNKYREANKEKVNAQRKKYYEERKEKDPDFLQYKRDKAKEYYLKKKEIKEVIKEEIKENIKPVLTFPCNDSDVEKYIEDVKAYKEDDEEKPPFEELIQIKPKAPRKPRAKKEIIKPNLQLEDLQDLVDQIVPQIPETPKVTKARKVKAKDILLSA
jgi:hypothetical protein